MKQCALLVHGKQEREGGEPLIRKGQNRREEGYPQSETNHNDWTRKGGAKKGRTDRTGKRIRRTRPPAGGRGMPEEQTIAIVDNIVNMPTGVGPPGCQSPEPHSQQIRIEQD